MSDSDDAAVDVIAPAIDIQKTPDLQTIVSGGDTTFTITVSNIGDVDLANAAVSDPLAPECDGAVGDLAAGASTSYTCTLAGVVAGFTNTATVTGTDPVGSDITDSDTADVAVLVPGIDIQKTPDLQTIVAGGSATFTITVTNSGATALSNVTVTDALAPDCDAAVGDLAVGESSSYTCTAGGVRADFTNTADVSGDDPLGNPVTDSDTADVEVVAPAITISKSPDGQAVVSGGAANFTIGVANTGDTDLTGVVVTDPQAPDCDNTIGDLVIGATVSYTCSLPNVTVDFTNIASVTGNDPLGVPVSDSDTADVAVEPCLDERAPRRDPIPARRAGRAGMPRESPPDERVPLGVDHADTLPGPAHQRRRGLRDPGYPHGHPLGAGVGCPRADEGLPDRGLPSPGRVEAPVCQRRGARETRSARGKRAHLQGPWRRPVARPRAPAWRVGPPG